MIETNFNPMIIVPIALAFSGFIFWFGKWVGTVNTDLSSFRKFVEEIRADIKKILGRLPQVPVSSASPLRLTEIGETISEKLETRNWAKETALLVADQIEGKQPFEIQEFCFSYIENDFKPTTDQDNQLREVAYSYGLKREQIIQVLVVVLRDELLKNAGFEPESLL